MFVAELRVKENREAKIKKKKSLYLNGNFND